jgi:hypothetical protein
VELPPAHPAGTCPAGQAVAGITGAVWLPGIQEPPGGTR